MCDELQAAHDSNQPQLACDRIAHELFRHLETKVCESVGLNYARKVALIEGLDKELVEMRVDTPEGGRQFMDRWRKVQYLKYAHQIVAPERAADLFQECVATGMHPLDAERCVRACSITEKRDINMILNCHVSSSVRSSIVDRGVQL